MSVPFSGLNVMDDNTPADAAGLLTFIKDTLVAAGQSAVANGAGWDITSGTTPQGLSFMSLWQPSGANVEVTFQDTSIGTTLNFLSTPGRTYRIVASPYQFFVYEIGASGRTVMAGVPFIPPPLVATTTEAWWSVAQRIAGDGDYTTFRESLTPNSPHNQYAFNGTLGTGSTGKPLIVLAQRGDTSVSNQAETLWYSGSPLDSECLCCFGKTSASVPSAMGVMWDMVAIWDQFATDLEQSFGGKNWVNISLATVAAPSLWVVNQ